MEINEMKTVSYVVSKNLFLVSQSKPADAVLALPKETPTNHILICDVSGSMWGEIDKVRDHIKTKLPKLMKDGDTLSVFAFSGRGQVYRILTAEPISTLKDLSDVYSALDRWLRCIGLTGFLEPIQAIEKLVAEVSKKNKNPFSVFFMTDGYDNQSSRADILKAVEKTAPLLSAATVVSYGHYSDLPFLTQIAEKWGGNLIVSDAFSKFSPALEAAIQKKVVGGKRVEVKVEGDALNGFVFATEGSDLITYGIEEGKVGISEAVETVWYLSPKQVGENGGNLDALAESAAKGKTSKDAEGPLAAAYAAISLFAVRMKPNVVLDLLKATGDVSFIDAFSTLFGKAKYAAFQEETKKAAFDKKARFSTGRDPKKVPREDAFTALQFLQLLQKDEDNRVLLSHEAFKYNRIGRSTVDANTRLTDEEIEELKVLTEAQGKEKDVNKIKEIATKIAALTNKPEPLKFIEDEAGKKEGYPVNKLVFNQDRPNVSIQVTKYGIVDLTGRVPEAFKGNKLGKIPDTFRSFIIRSLTMVKDAMPNATVLPCRLTPATMKALDEAIRDGRLPAHIISHEGGVTFVKLAELPVTNRNETKEVSAEEMFRTQWDLLKWQAAQKVWNSYKTEHFPGKKSEGFEALYGKEGSTWLAEVGITERSGFGPKVRQADPTDVYVAKCLEIKTAGYSTIPSLNEFKKQADKGKYNGPGTLMKPAVKEMADFLASDPYKSADEATQKEILEKFVTGKAEEATGHCRDLLYKLAQMKMSIIVSQTWFKEFSSLDQNSMKLKLDGNEIEFTAVLSEYEEKI